jgi:DNA repair protein SbcC/Rad50
MRLLRLSLRSFMSWDSLTLDLSECDVVGVTGRVGHGKSALLDAILWTIYGEGRASADAMVRQGEDRASAEVEFEAAGRRVLVRRERERGKATALTLEVDGQSLTRHTVAETQAAIDELVGVSSDALLATAVMVQGRSDEFVRLRPAERMALLSDLVVEDPYPAWHEEARRRRDEARKAAWEQGLRRAMQEDAGRGADAAELRQAALRQAAAAERAREEAEASQQALRDAESATAGMRATAETRARLEAEVERVGRERERLEEEQSRLRAVVAQPDLPMPTMPDLTALQVAEQAAEEARMAAAVLPAERDDLVRAMQDEARARAAVAARATVPCGGAGIYAACPLLAAIPTPEQVIETAGRTVLAADRVRTGQALAGRLDSLHGKAERLREEWRAWERDAAMAEASRDARAERRAEAARSLSDAEARLASLATVQDSARAELAALSGPESERLAAREAMIVALREDAEGAAAAARRLGEQSAVTSREADHAEQAAREAESAGAESERQSALASSYAALAEAWHPYGIPRLIVEEAIPRIEAHANEALQRLPGGFVLRLSTSREKRSGGSMDTLDVTVEVGSRERDYALLSGGERFRVDLALRLGIAGLLAERTGRRVNTAIFDEPLAPGDEQEREAVLEAISALSEEYGLIMVMSHDAEFADALPWSLHVTKVDGASQAELVRQ